MKKSVFGIARSESHANETLRKLQDAGFEMESISALLRDKRSNLKDVTYNDMDLNRNDNMNISRNDKKMHKGRSDLGHEKHTKAPEGAASGAAAGGLIGGTLGLLAGIGSLAIPGLGAFIAAGPIMAALSGSAIGGSLGLVIGSLVGLGMPEYVAKSYEGRLKSGGVLLSVHCESEEEVNQAKRIFEDNGIEDISTVTETAAKSRR